MPSSASTHRRPMSGIIGRTQTNGPRDYEAVHAVQDGYRRSRLSEWGQAPSPLLAESDPSIDMVTPPLDQVNAMSGEQFFAMAAELMKLHPPHVTDWSVVSRMRRIGLVPGQSFDPSSLSADASEAVAGAAQTGQAALAAQMPTMAQVINGWQMNVNSIGVYGDFYAKRGVVAMMGLGANQAEDAVYPLLMADANGDNIEGSRDYLLHFDKGQLPPVAAFWSVTMYDEHGFQVANEINRFAIGDRDPSGVQHRRLLDLYLQHTNPGPDRESNRLPLTQWSRRRHRYAALCARSGRSCGCLEPSTADSADPLNEAETPRSSISVYRLGDGAIASALAAPPRRRECARVWRASRRGSSCRAPSPSASSRGGGPGWGST